MELVLILLALAAAVWILGGPVAVFVLWVRFRKLEDVVSDLRRERFATAAIRRPVQSPDAEVLGDEAFQEPAGAQPVGTRAAPPPPLVPFDPRDFVEHEPKQDSLRELAEARSSSAPPPPPAVAEHAPAAVSRSGDSSTLEELLAGQWLTWVGALAIIIGAGFFLKYAIDQEFLGPTGRVVLGLLGGMACFVGGAYAMLRGYRYLAQGVVGAALGILYFSLFAAFQWYEIVPQTPAFVGMVLVTAAALAFSAYFSAQATAILGLIGGFLTPVMLSTGTADHWTLFSYILILDLGVLGVAAFRKWHALQVLSFLFTILVWLGWFAAHYDASKLIDTTILMTSFFLLFALLGIWHNVLRRTPADPADYLLILATPVAYFVGLYAVTSDEYAFLHGVLAVGLAGIYLVLAFLSLSRNPAGRPLIVALGGIAASFLTIAIPLQLTGHWIAIAWAAESLLLVELGLRFNEAKLRWAGFGLLAFVQLILIFYASSTFADPGQFDTRFVERDPFVEDVMPGGVMPRERSLEPPDPSWTDVFNGRSFSFLASALVMGVLAWEYRGRRTPDAEVATFRRELIPEGEPGLWLTAAVPLTVLALLLVETYAQASAGDWLFTTVVGVFSVWTALVGLVVAGVAVTWGPRRLEMVAIGVFALLSLFIVVNFFGTLGDWRSQWQGLEAQGYGDSIWRWPLINPRGIGYLTAIAAALAAAYAVRRPEAVEEPGVSTRFRLDRVLGLFAYFTGLALVTVETYAQGVVRDWQTGTSLAITFVWTAYAIATLAGGILQRSAQLRLISLGLFLVTAAKVFLYDVWHLDTTIRWFAFMGLGVSLLLVSYLYRRYRDRIRAWMRPATVLVLIGLVLGTSGSRAGADEPPPAQRPELLVQSLSHRWPIRSVPEGGGGSDRGTLVRIALPPDLFGVARTDLGDVRTLAVAESAETALEIPYVLVRPQDEERVSERAAPLLNLSQIAGDTEFLLDVGDRRQPVDELAIDVADRNGYVRAVQVYGSNERNPDDWNLLSGSEHILRLTGQGREITVDRVRFPQSDFRYYRVLIENRGEPPLDVQGARLFDREQVQAPRTEYPGRILSQELDLKEKASVLIVDLGYDRLPTVALALTVADDDGNFHRRISIEAADTLDKPERWFSVTNGQVYRIERPDVQAVSQEIAYPETKARYLRLKIYNGDDLPLTVGRVTAVSVNHYLIVDRRRIPEGSRPAAVYAGNEKLEAPSYDLAQTLGRMEVRELPVVELAGREVNPLYGGPLLPEVPWSERNQPLLWAITLGGVAILGVLTFLILRHAAKSGPIEPT